MLEYIKVEAIEPCRTRIAAEAEMKAYYLTFCPESGNTLEACSCVYDRYVTEMPGPHINSFRAALNLNVGGVFAPLYQATPREVMRAVSLAQEITFSCGFKGKIG